MLIEQLLRVDIKMNYFQTLPKLVVKEKQSAQIITNLLARVNIISDLFQDPLLFYTYDIKDSDTPEIIAHKYYGDVNRFWMVLFSNEIVDPQWDWPMSTKVFDSYINDKYSPIELTQVHHYEKIITTTNLQNNMVKKEVITISEDDYNSLLETSKNYTTITGDVNIQISKNVVDNYTYEYDLNESKRTIKLINKVYATRIETEFNKLMNS